MTITVVAAIVEDDDRFLVTRRPEGTDMAGLWEFPGGKVHQNESHADALRREMVEELDTDVLVGELVHRSVFPYPERTVDLYFYRCALLGTPKPILGQEMAWVTREALAALQFPEADRELIEVLTKR